MYISSDGQSIIHSLTGEEAHSGRVVLSVADIQDMIARHKRLPQNLHDLRHGTRVERAKAVRDMTGCHIREAVQIVDNLLGYSA